MCQISTSSHEGRRSRPIDEYQQEVVAPLALWERSHEVHRDGLQKAAQSAVDEEGPAAWSMTWTGGKRGSRVRMYAFTAARILGHQYVRFKVRRVSTSKRWAVGLRPRYERFKLTGLLPYSCFQRARLNVPHFNQ